MSQQQLEDSLETFLGGKHVSAQISPVICLYSSFVNFILKILFKT